MFGKIKDLMTGKSLEFEKNSILLFAISMAGNVLNYLFQIIMGKQLSVEDYGEFNTLFSLTMIASLASGVLLVVVSKYTAVFSAREEPQKIGALAVKMLRVCLFLGAATWGIGSLLSGVLSRAFSLSAPSIVYMFFIAGIGFINATPNGILQGSQKFLHYGLAGLASSAGKFAAGIALVWMGYGVFGLQTATLASILLAFLYAHHHAKPYIRLHKGGTSLPEMRGSAFAAFFTSSFVLQCCLTLVNNMDLLCVRYFFTGEEAGIYSSAMVLGRISMYLSGAVVAVAFPVAAARAAVVQETKTTFIKMLVYGGGLSLASATFLTVLAAPIVRIFFGARYYGAEALLFPISVFVFAVALVTIIVNYELAIGNAKFLCLSFAAGLAVMVGAAALCHSTITSMVLAMAAALLAVVAVNIVHILFRKKTGRPSPAKAEEK